MKLSRNYEHFNNINVRFQYKADLHWYYDDRFI